MPAPSRFSISYLLLALVVAGFIIFWKLGSLPAQQWDEARTGLNALESLRPVPHPWLVSYYLGQPDLWNVKPPLLRWLQMGSFWALGPSELALRLPSALAALATVAVVWAAGRRWLGHPAAGLLAALILATTGGFVVRHVARSGDYDALLTLWTTLTFLCGLGYLATGRARLAAGAGAALALAVLTKGVAGLLPGPGLLVAAILTGTAGPRLRRPATWVAAAGVVAVAAGWYGLREWAAPGYLAAVRSVELNSAAAALSHNGEPWYYYLGRLLEGKFSPWLAAALLGWVLGWRAAPGSGPWWLARGTAAVGGVGMLALSVAPTKLLWYDAPLYPLLALAAAAGLWQAGQAIGQRHVLRPGPGALVGVVLLVAAGPYAERLAALRDEQSRRFEQPQLLYGQHLRAQAAQLPQLTAYLLATDDSFNDSPNFYREATVQRYGHYIERVASWRGAPPPAGAVLVVCGAVARRRWQQDYEVEILLQTDSCTTLRLAKRR